MTDRLSVDQRNPNTRRVSALKLGHELYLPTANRRNTLKQLMVQSNPNPIRRIYIDIKVVTEHNALSNTAV